MSTAPATQGVHYNYYLLLFSDTEQATVQYANLLLSSNSSRQLKDKKLRTRNGEQLGISTVIYRNNKIMLEDLHLRKTKITKILY